MPSAVSRLAARTFRLLPRKRLSRALGNLASVPLTPSASQRLVDAYVRAYDVDLADAEVPAGGWRSFDQFFTRTLREGARPVEGGAETLVSPSDGKLEDTGPVDDDAHVRVKGQRYSVDALLGEPGAGERFVGGWYWIVYLSPRDYHRVHAPVDGPIDTVRYVGGTLLPVNDFGVTHYPGLFARNERVVFWQRSPLFGAVATVMVGAVGVGRISVSFDPSVTTNVGRGPLTRHYPPEQAPSLARGDELGIFHLGSTAVVFAPPSAALRSEVRPGQRVRMGSTMAVRRSAAREADA